ncbi:hypothetical protein [Sinomonas sp. ASV322]|nr:hypothetical protein [Sinomonas sp. ASV322]MDQ4504065.1 hypothetical protein [Sinomonas sp. ASV322]
MDSDEADPPSRHAAIDVNDVAARLAPSLEQARAEARGASPWGAVSWAE